MHFARRNSGFGAGQNRAALIACVCLVSSWIELGLNRTVRQVESQAPAPIASEDSAAQVKLLSYYLVFALRPKTTGSVRRHQNVESRTRNFHLVAST